MSSTTASAISATTSELRIRRRTRLSPPPGVPSRSGVSTSPEADCRAGASPNTIPEAIASPATVSTIPGSRSNFIQKGSGTGIEARQSRIPHSPRRTPSAPPVHDRSRLSVSIWRMSRAREAPSATRTPISRWRVVARARSRFATFAQAMSSTNVTASASMIIMGRMSRVRLSLISMSANPASRFVSGYCRSMSRAIASISLRACCNVTPGASRANESR